MPKTLAELSPEELEAMEPEELEKLIALAEPEEGDPGTENPDPEKEEGEGEGAEEGKGEGDGEGEEDPAAKLEKLLAEKGLADRWKYSTPEELMEKMADSYANSDAHIKKIESENQVNRETLAKQIFENRQIMERLQSAPTPKADPTEWMTPEQKVADQQAREYVNSVVTDGVGQQVNQVQQLVATQITQNAKLQAELRATKDEAFKAAYDGGQIRQVIETEEMRMGQRFPYITPELIEAAYDRVKASHHDELQTQVNTTVQAAKTALEEQKKRAVSEGGNKRTAKGGKVDIDAFLEKAASGADDSSSDDFLEKAKALGLSI